MTDLETIEMGEGNTKTPPPSQPTQCKHWCFTLNNYSRKDIELLETTFKHLCYMYCFQEEMGEQGTPHLQGVISLIKRARWSEFGLMKEIHWSKTRMLTQSYLYCSKEETRHGDIFTFNYKVANKKKLKLLDEINFTPWQKQIIEIIKEEPDDRAVHWFWSEKGKMGKSTFAKYLVAKKNALFFEEGKKADIMKLIFDADMDEKNLIVVDIPRDNGNRISYKSVESIKNGMIYSPKYEGGYKLFNAPHFIVFANEPPETKRLSEDRWNIYNIDETS